MAEGIRDKVAILGMGCTRFGERWESGAEELMVEAFQEALTDAGIEKEQIDAAYLGCCFDEISLGKSAISLSTTLRLPFIPATRVENFCATGMEAFRAACYAVASGASDVALALGVEKLKDTGYGGLPDFGTVMGTRNRTLFPNVTAPGAFAMLATRYFARYGLSAEEGKRVIARVSWKSHQNGRLHEKAHLRANVTMEDILAAPLIAWPLGLYDCSGVSDGAACAIVTRPEIARRRQESPVKVKALQVAVTSGEEQAWTGWEGTHVETTRRAADRAYREAGIDEPRRQLSLLEVHDCFSNTELVTLEDLRISPEGHAAEDLLAGFYDLGGPLPCQTDGGLKCFGHPIAASGLRMLYELYNQLLERAGERQVKAPELALAHNLGGFPSMSVASVGILGR